MALSTAEAYISVLIVFLTMITIPIYSFIIAVFIRYRRSAEAKSNCLYIQIVIVKGFIDILSAINCTFGSLLPSLGALSTVYLGEYGMAIAQVYLWTAWGSRLMQGCSCVLLSVNRCTILLNPVKFTQVSFDKCVFCRVPRRVFVATGIGFFGRCF
ncbi:unnamed protein product [Gongylonema pulchrum]|uniref:G protein-coupled receptor n=1 Tax=Gongylonema pulchrum TaxID=637853 RepID=A0A183CWH0_9BILA|nr:unnamed protein product [Gongylonema pulchrum]